MDSGRIVDVIYFDIIKVLDTVPHKYLYQGCDIMVTIVGGKYWLDYQL